MSIEDIRIFIATWNNLYPVDYVFRKKYKIPFNSTEHRSMSLLDMRIDLEEDLMYGELDDKKEEKKRYVPATGNFLKKNKKSYVKMTEEEADELFDLIKIGEVIPNK